jgi:hypothetical protein
MGSALSFLSISAWISCSETYQLIPLSAHLFSHWSTPFKKTNSHFSVLLLVTKGPLMDQWLAAKVNFIFYGKFCAQCFTRKVKRAGGFAVVLFSPSHSLTSADSTKYIEYTTVSVPRPNRDLPTASPARECTGGGGGYTSAWGGGVGESQFGRLEKKS